MGQDEKSSLLVHGLPELGCTPVKVIYCWSWIGLVFDVQYRNK